MWSWAILAVCGTALSASALAQAPKPPPEAPADPKTATTPDEGVEVASPYEGRFVAQVRIEGLKRVKEQFALNQIRVSEGRPLEWAMVREDVRRLQRLGEFRGVEALIEAFPDGSVAVVFIVTEAPIVRDVVVVGNRQIPDEQIATVTSESVALIAGVPIDDYRVGQGQRAIENLYREKGYYQVEVTVDESELESAGIIQFKVREGERTRVTVIRFEGNKSFADKYLRSEIKTETADWFHTAPLDDEVLDRDVAAIVKFYRDHGYLDARVSRRIQPSPDSKEAIVIFLVEEGRVYTLRKIIVQGRARADDEENTELKVYTPEQLAGIIELKPGDVFSEKNVDKAVEKVKDAYLKLGYVDSGVVKEELRQGDDPLVDLRITVREGERFKTGMVVVQGNDLTQSKVVRRLITIKPDHWLDGTEAKETERRVKDSGYFEINPGNGKPPKVTIQPENPETPGYRDVLVEVTETDTGSLSFGAAVSSDSGLFGIINLTQKNFDLADTPDSWDELISGKAFRGAGQTFNLAIQPGIDQSNYSLTITEPWLFETPYSLSNSIVYSQRDYNEFDEDRAGDRIRVARRFGTQWTGGMNVRAQDVRIYGIDNDSPQDIWDVKGHNFITGVGFDLARTTTDNRFRPTSGTRTELAVEEVGALGGDFSFTRFTVEHNAFFAIDEDYLGRKTVLSLVTRSGYLLPEDEAPVFERFYMGGRSFRGFKYRGIGPLGIRHDTGTPSDEHVGGDFSFFLGTEVEKPVFSDMISVVAFVDSGTINDNFGLDEYRVTAGMGLRLYLPAFGQAPLAFDFAFPVRKFDGDKTQIFSFAIDLPF